MSDKAVQDALLAELENWIVKARAAGMDVRTWREHWQAAVGILVYNVEVEGQHARARPLPKPEVDNA